MIFNDSSNYTGICNDIDFLLFGSSTATSPYAIADKTRAINNWYDNVVTLILKSDGRFEWDDNNKTDLPIATTALVADQQDYNISGASFLKILKVELKDANGNWMALSPISLDDKRNESMTDYQKTAGTPREYDKLGNSVFLYPKPNYSQAASLKIFYQRNVTHFVVGDTTAVPGFAENFHKILAYGAALEYAIAHSMVGKINIFIPLIQKMEADIVEFYSDRDRSDKKFMSFEREDYGQEDSSYEGEVGITAN